MPRQQRSYGTPRGLQTIFPEPIIANRAPDTADTGYLEGQLWVDPSAQNAYILLENAGGISTWALIEASGGNIATLTGDSGGAISPVSNNIDLLGGTNIASVGTSGTITFNLDDAISLSTSVTSPIYTTSGADMNINADTNQDILIQMGDDAGAQKISFEDSGSAEVANIDSDGAATFTDISSSVGADLLGGDVDLNASSNNDTNINTGTSTGSVAIGNGSAGAITLDSGAGISFDGAATSNFSVTGSGVDINFASDAGRLIMTSGEDAGDSIYLHADAGTSETIRLHSDQGTGADSVHLESDVGGVTLTSGLASTDAINLNATAGGVDIDGALEINITSSESSVADAITISASAADSGITLDAGETPGVTFTNGTQSHQMLVGSGSPDGSVTASQGSMYIDVSGSTSTTILFVNTDGGTTWVGVGA